MTPSTDRVHALLRGLGVAPALYTDGALSARSPIDGAVTGRVAESRRPIAIEDVTRDDRFSWVRGFDVEALAGMLSVPLIWHDAVVGVLNVQTREVRRFTDDIADWDVRLAVKEKQLQRTYTALETALGKARSQGQWLSGQLANLPTSGSS